MYRARSRFIGPTPFSYSQALQSAFRKNGDAPINKRGLQEPGRPLRSPWKNEMGASHEPDTSPTRKRTQNPPSIQTPNPNSPGPQPRRNTPPLPLLRHGSQLDRRHPDRPRRLWPLPDVQHPRATLGPLRPPPRHSTNPHPAGATNRENFSVSVFFSPRR